MTIMVKRALISVYDKTGILELAEFLHRQGVEIISTGGTFHYLTENNIPATEVNQITQMPEMLNGRVKTLHPAVFGGILAKRDNPQHLDTMQALNLGLIDMVVVNLYPFF
ncbi:MAG: bifunctional phosphoribosylaminoimidazolecarboxamide formyltransferase/IMP cyclohydrolase, partial [Pasteurella sp.]|nr:bifunctional phosphoribosylaminoimidazolecarboxamide formyltransferase/IMP cyclohydrolase [Pasteurella sp.]